MTSPDKTTADIDRKETKGECIFLGALSHSVFTGMAYTLFPFWVSVIVSFLLVSFMASVLDND